MHLIVITFDVADKLLLSNSSPMLVLLTCGPQTNHQVRPGFRLLKAYRWFF